MSSIRNALSMVTLVLTCVLPAVPAGADDASGHPRAALVIGDASYQTLNPVSSAANDEHDMCEALTGLGYEASCFVDVKDAREFKARVQDFAAALKPKSEVIFYYAGHALQIKGENYLAPVTAAPRSDADVPREAVSLAYVLAQLLQGKHYLSVAILDTCRGPAWPAASHGMTAGLAPITVIPKGTLVMYATAPAGYAAQTGDRNGTFTRHLLANIKTPGLTADELFRKISEGVQGEAGDAGAGEAATSVQSPALYTNFTGEFCVGGCIDKVARAELEKIEKENEEQLEQARKQKAELEARKREAQARLVEAAVSANCGASVLGDTGRCFATTPDIALKSVATALIQRGFILRPDMLEARNGLRSQPARDTRTGSVDSWWVSNGLNHPDDRAQETELEAERGSDDPTDRNVSETIKVSVKLRHVPSINRCIVTFSANRRTVLHDKFHTWSTIGIVPIATSKQYHDVVKNDVNVTDPAFYQDLLAATESDLHTRQASSSASVPTADASGSGSGSSGSGGGGGDSRFRHEHRFDAPVDLVVRTLVEALVARGYIVKSLDSELGTIGFLRRTQDSGDKHRSTESVVIASVSMPEGGTASQLQLAADDVMLLRHNPSDREKMAQITSGIYDYEAEGGWQTIVLHDGVVTDPGFYQELFTAIESSLHGSAAPSKHSQRIAASDQQTLHAVGDALAQHGYLLLSTEQTLAAITFFKRTATPLKTNDGWTSTSIIATVYLRNQPGGEPTAYVAASSQSGLFQSSPVMTTSFLFGASMKPDAPHDCHIKKKCTLQEVEAKFVGSSESAGTLDKVTQEGDADAAAYSDITAIVAQSTR
jgi:caspase domain-containing protein